ncbi:MAG: hypothetical protein JWO13_1719 [Acidobacteriales bacterium]|nr:hypothetical protein [Terriglobales bacterium]
MRRFVAPQLLSSLIYTRGMPPERIPNAIDPQLEARIWERRRRFAAEPFQTDGDGYKLEPAVDYDGLVVFDFADPMLFGGGAVHAPDFLRALMQLRIGPCERLCDFCGGVGYIGYSLLSRRFCKTLCFVDLNARAIDAVNFTARHNGIENLVTTYVSDALDQVPENERWDLVVCNPPQLLPRVQTDKDTVMTFDPEWRLHRKFYSNLKNYMNPGAHAVVMGARYETTAKTFQPMIEAGGGRVVAEIPAKDFRGAEDDRYFLVTQW